MVTTNFHTPERTRLLWVYEGLTQYLGEVLTVRAGLAQHSTIIRRVRQTNSIAHPPGGRRWRALEDTAIASWLNRAQAVLGQLRRRSQDYYDEGLVVWLEADAYPRENRRPKDVWTISAKFFAADRAEASRRFAAYELKEVTSALRELADEDWEKFFRKRISLNRARRSGSSFSPKLSATALQYSAKPSDYRRDREKDRKQAIGDRIHRL